MFFHSAYRNRDRRRCTKKMRQSMPHFCVTDQIPTASEAEITLAGFYLFDAFGSDASHLFIGYIGKL